MIRTIFLLTTLAGLVIGCKSDPVEERVIDDANKKLDLGFEASDYVVNTFYNVPSPSEQLETIAELDGTVRSDYVNDLSKSNEYLTSTKQCLNFGVYCADATYLSAHDQNNVALRYLSTLNQMGESIGLNAILGDELAKVIDGETNPETLFKLADEMYLRAFDRLIENEKGEDLGLILVGAWYETMHLVMNSSNGFEKSPMLNDYIANQKIVAENLLSFLMDYQENAEVSEYVDDLNEVLTIYSEMDCTYSDTKVKRDKVENSNRISVSGGTKCKLNETVFENLKTNINKVRSKIVD